MFNFNNPFADKNDTGRDKRRSFTQSQKNEILYQQNGKCAKCHKRLDPRDIEFDHKKPWADKGRTITQNGRALCGSCHNIVNHGQRLKKVDKKLAKKTRSPVDDIIKGPKLDAPNPMYDILGTGSLKKKKGKGGFGLL